MPSHGCDAVKLDFAFGIVPVACLNHDTQQYLLIRHQKGHWGFPKGHKEGDESDLCAAQREFEEETGIRNYHVFPNVHFTEKYQFHKKKGQRIAKTVKYFMAIIPTSGRGDLPDVHIQEAEIQDFCWCTSAEAYEKLNFIVTHQVLADCEHALSQIPPDRLLS